MESQIIAYYNPNFQSQSRAARPADSLMGVIGENVEITRLKAQVARLERELAEIKQVEEDQAELIRDWEGVGLGMFSVDTPDDVGYRIQELFDENLDLERTVEEEEEKALERLGALTKLKAEKAEAEKLYERERGLHQEAMKMMLAASSGGEGEDGHKFPVNPEIEKLKEENAALTEENETLKEEQQGEEALVLAHNCERLLCAIHGKDYEDAELYSFGAADIIAGDAIEVAIKKIEGWKASRDDHIREAKVEICPDDVNPCDDGWVEKPTPTRVKDMLEIDDGYLADVESAVREVFQERGITIIDGDAPKMTRSGKCY